jgi:non-lysosomal glucosylceramidase
VILVSPLPIFMRFIIVFGAVLRALAACSLSAAESFNPSPAVLESPGDSESAARLGVGSEGKTPTAKEFKPGWISSLDDRGQPVVDTKENSKDFAYIGMPVGGIGAGELYLGGDGRLWNWDIFNTRVAPGFPVEQGRAYLKPHEMNDANDNEQIVVRQGFVLRTTSGGKTVTHTLDRDGFPTIQFSGQYPIGYVSYAAPDCPVGVKLEAFSPFVPGVADDSTYPATILRYTLENNSGAPVTCELAGWMENAVAVQARLRFDVDLHNTVVTSPAAISLVCSATEAAARHAAQPPVTFDDFEDGTYGNWKVEGTAFGSAPDTGSVVPGGKPPKGFQGKYLVNSFAATDSKATGKLTSKDFPINNTFISFLIAGGNFPGEECVNLIVDDKIVETATGGGGANLTPVHWKVEHLLGKTGHLEIVDSHMESAKWRHILVDQIVFSDSIEDFGTYADQPDIGTMALTLLGDPKQTVASAQLGSAAVADAAIDLTPVTEGHVAVITPNDNLVGALKRSVSLAPGEKTTISYLVTWCFPNPLELSLKTPTARQYSTRFATAVDVVKALVRELPRLTQSTELWHDTWYDSTLPYWFLDRTFANVSTLASGTTYLLSDGRFYGYEGCYSCPGTCTHVWGYQQALGFLYPSLEKELLEKVELNQNLGMNAEGGVAMRAEFDKTVPVDGQAGILMRSYLADRMSSDHSFLKNNYPAIKQAADFLVKTYDASQSGILRGGQHNTMDAAWYGEVAWLSLYYQAALLATAEMADRMEDHDYAASLRKVADQGRQYIEQHLFNGEYFFQNADPAHADSPGVYIGCQSDQLLGQNWANQTGLGYILNPEQERTALNSIWKYNYTTDAGLYRKVFTGGRNYTCPGEGAVVMCTFPLGGEDALKKGRGSFSAYMNETWAGCEHALAATMMWQGLVDKALAVERTINDRYAADKRDPWDECECGSHYSRSMDSYGVFIAACGFEYDGPAGYMAFSPRIHPDHFKAAFTSADGWGSFAQDYQAKAMTASIDLRFGRLSVQDLALSVPPGCPASTVTCGLAGKTVPVTSELSGNRVSIHFAAPLQMNAGQTLKVNIQ